MNEDKRNRITRIFDLFSRKRYSPELEEDTHRWMIAKEDEEEKREASYNFWKTIKASPGDDDDNALEEINRKIKKRNRQMGKTRSIVYAAAVFASLFVISVSLMFILDKEEDTVEVVTAYGETQQVILPDGTEIRLQAGSKLTYPKAFTADQRLLRLNGEALFLVEKDESRPFVVEAGSLKVRVLGTKFNLRAYPGDDRITTTLMQGSVEVIHGEDTSITLNPGEQLVYNRITRETKLKILSSPDESVNPEEILSFDDASLTEILRSIERKFDVRIKQNPALLRERYTVRFHKDDNLDTIIAVLEETVDDYSFKRQANEIVIAKKDTAKN